MKVQKLTVSNFKAIDEQELILNGSSCIVTGRNDAGKTSLLRGLQDRFRSECPEIILKEGSSEGYSIIELTNGDKIEWKFKESANGKTNENFVWTKADGEVVSKGVLSRLSKEYFGEKFDIDKFLNSQPKEQSTQLQKLCGLDFSEIDRRYKKEYDNRTFEKQRLQIIQAKTLLDETEVEVSDVEKISKEVEAEREFNSAELKKINDNNLEETRKYEEAKRNLFNEITEHNNEIRIKETDKIRKQVVLKDYELQLEKVNDVFNTQLTSTIPEQLKTIIDSIRTKTRRSYDDEVEQISKPNLLSTNISKEKLTMLLENLEKANKQQKEYDAYISNKKHNDEWRKELKHQLKLVYDAEKAVEEIDTERKEMIKNSKVPKEFTFTDNNELLYNGFPLNGKQISTSAKYIAGLKLGAMALGEIRAIHFDASPLDNNNLKEIFKWAEENNLQLFVERPDYSGSEIKYEIIERR